MGIRERYIKNYQERAERARAHYIAVGGPGGTGFTAAGGGGGAGGLVPPRVAREVTQYSKAHRLMRDLYMTPEEAYRAVGLEWGDPRKCKWCQGEFEAGIHTEHGKYCKHCFGPR